MLVLLVPQRQIRDPDEHLSDPGCMPRLGRRLDGRNAVFTGLVEILGEVAEQVLYHLAHACPLGIVAQHRCRDVEVPVCLLGVAAPTRELRLRQRQLRQRIRPGDSFRATLRLGHSSCARLLIAQQPVQLGLPRPHRHDILDGTDLGDDRDRVFVVLASTGELAAGSDSIRQLGQGERNPPPLAERAELGERSLEIGVRIPAVAAKHDPHLAEVQPGKSAYPGVFVGEQRFERGQERVRRLQHAFQRGHELQRRVMALNTLADFVSLVDPLLRLVLVTPPGGHEQYDERVHHGPDLVGRLAGRGDGCHDQLVALRLVPTEPPIPAGGSGEPHRPVGPAGRERTAHRGTDVVVLDLDRGKPFQLLGAAKMRLRDFGEFGEIREMRTARQIRFPRLREPVLGVLLDRAEHPVARRPVALGETSDFSVSAVSNSST